MDNRTLTVLASWFQQVRGITLEGIGMPCFLRYYTGFYCPGCGGTRAVSALLQGNILKSLYYHPIVPYAVLICLLYMVSLTIKYLSKGRWAISFPKGNAWIHVGTAIVLVNWVLRNILYIIL